MDTREHKTTKQRQGKHISMGSEKTKGIESKQQKRVKYLDIIKAISIFLVVFCHSPLLNPNSVLGNIAMIICWGAVPCFFMTTGAIYLNREWNFKKYIRKLLSIYLMICIWKIIYICIYQCIGTIDVFSTSKKLLFDYVFLFNGLPGIVDGHFWFMYAYLSIFAIYPVFNLLFAKIKEYKQYLICILIILFLCTAFTWTMSLILEYFHVNDISINNIRSINPFGNYAHMLFYFLIGGFLYKNNIYEKFRNKKALIRIVSILFIVVGVIGLVLIKKHQSNTFEFQYIWLKNGYNWSSTILLSTGLFIFLQGLEIKSKIVSRILIAVGKNTMGIFYLHIPVLELLRLFSFSNRGVIMNLAKSTIVIGTCYALIIIMKKIPAVKRLLLM